MVGGHMKPSELEEAARRLREMIPEEQWPSLPRSIVEALANGATWLIVYEAKERKEGAHWYPTVNPEAARRTGHYVNAIARAALPAVDGKPYACTVRHESDEMLGKLLDMVALRARKELALRTDA